LLEEPGNRAADAHAEVVLRKGVQEKRRRKKEKKKERPIVVTLANVTLKGDNCPCAAHPCAAHPFVHFLRA